MNLPNKKWLTMEQALEVRASERAAGQTMVMTNGCFDLLHVGHISYLQESKKLGDHLWILINSDESVRALKGPTRPIQSEAERAFSLAALSCIDYIVVFNKPRLTEEIQLLKPDIYTKAGDYTIDTLYQPEREAFDAVGAQIKFLPFLEGFSTTKMIEKIHKAGSI
ncbi:ADP-heptose synthase (EC / D-glycero-beta-D-manno-heptose 7-phosphate kinase [Lentimonas sp. CC19]|uniref:adenylyltransferase/cytidyltransferase family protein n=1 Tax=unclassified Lentimonas TaxID=2630993 RepID=UPI001322A23D|nr:MULTISPECIES: adenylyltransferase/cytidyltransferase family protein [unclassified Lentimonas]CAA6683727.1 ADP-heptose synthase (EC / D-glycero-beta-D-manno-heptose 7-phosphate kinase [Lentimonas sp. CC6]CAA6691367.1 ADP-heptose synthase (EC / D-glycero-beta-D-manno-heptose 7-phosphate kinase [Lentimonas sp. CC19]CAA6694924.1 ADP-heptose synthase (EC / D-glycero-beta-D-manno-heptose 7-phosphate kinase [Lentimonas sp. CC10]CAA7071893.1 ADP-heptose synthase (EC / D-glycero-beta-D-manno-heptose 